MASLKSVAVAVISLGVSTTAMSGTLNAFTFYPAQQTPVTALSDNVTYSALASGKLPALTTYAGFNVGDPGTGLLLQNTSGNTLNHITITVTFSVTNAAETLTLYAPDVYLKNVPCSWATNADGTPKAGNPVLITCNVSQMKAGDTFPSFTAFLVAPVFNCTPTTTTTCSPDTISTDVNVLYAEGPNGGPTSPQNSSLDVAQADLVQLGTNNPINVKSAVPKGGSQIFTGIGGVPVAGTTPSTQLNVFTEAGKIPNLSISYTVAQILISQNTDAACSSFGNFTICPTYQTTIANGSVETRFLDPDNPLALIYRVDSSILKQPPSKLLTNVVFYYTGKAYVWQDPDPVTGPWTGDGGTWSGQLVKSCANGTTAAGNPIPKPDGMPCIVDSATKCYKNLKDANGIQDLVGDCEWKLINTGNGLIKIQ